MNKYKKKIKGVEIDVYDILHAFEVKSHAIGHAIKKLLMAGKRGHKDTITDLKEAQASIEREIEMLTPAKQYVGERVVLKNISDADVQEFKEDLAKSNLESWVKHDGNRIPPVHRDTEVLVRFNHGRDSQRVAKKIDWEHVKLYKVISQKPQVEDDGWFENLTNSLPFEDEATVVEAKTKNGNTRFSQAKNLNWHIESDPNFVIKYRVKTI